MFVLFCQSPIDRKVPDETYEGEYAAVKALKAEAGLIDFEALTNGDAEKAVCSVPSWNSQVDVIYRGWMMSPQVYETLFQALSKKGVNLINTPEQYRHCHYLPEWLSDVAKQTPMTRVLPISSLADVSLESLSQVLEPFGASPVVVKDFVKSEKHYWHEACFIPNAGNSEHALKITKRFLELRGTNLEGGLVFRKFETFTRIGTHAKSQVPLTEEYRAFILYGKVLSVMKYWDEAKYPDSKLDVAAVLQMVANVNSRFFTVDFARLESREWMIVELGDGQVSGLPDGADVKEFYKAIAHRLAVR